MNPKVSKTVPTEVSFVDLVEENRQLKYLLKKCRKEMKDVNVLFYDTIKILEETIKIMDKQLQKQ